MIDELLGRASLKERIDELEAEAERLRRRYEAESERRSEAVTAKQTAEERQNRLEDRIAQLEGELERREGDGRTDLEFRRREQLRGSRLRSVLDRLESVRAGDEGAFTATIDDDGEVETAVGADGQVPDEVATVLGERTALLADAGPCLLCVDDAGLVATTLDPPLLPSVDPVWDDRFALDRSWFLPTGRYALALVRTDLFAVGVYEDSECVRSRGFESDVKGTHSKGGFSQARFERIRDEQIDAHLDRAADAVTDVRADVDQFYLTGQRGVLEPFATEAGLEPDASVAVDATGDPEPALDDAFRSFWTTDLQTL
ncbi:Vms1/Ankzf1 family peptidyl-tRNA hydrolase [Halobacteria archaeon AArc-dxtr1]|nr:Vms1/Ankzf1 family peptidyl-tRNA hydrolase [Halobacteria archaeon AArc-dxtr1]